MFRVYSSDDLIGVELGGALKNPIALAVGMLYGLKLGDNTMGALLTRGLAEITRLGVRMGARSETFAGLSGLGDLVTTCVSQHSRNRFVGERIGCGEKLVDILASMTMVAEGVETTRAAVRVAELHKVEMPITQQVHKVLFENKPPLEALSELMTRELKREVYA
jgi:glycerol-3-phosphate dehydrogenase (NAD(P)+)